MRMKKLLKKLLRISPIILFFGIIIYSVTITHFEKKHFFESKLNTIVIKKKNNLTGGRTYDYITRNNIVITIGKSDCSNLELGDSIVKKANNWEFDIFKRDINGEFKFYRSCNYISP
jgi:hypothetical protein